MPEAPRGFIKPPNASPYLPGSFSAPKGQRTPPCVRADEPSSWAQTPDEGGGRGDGGGTDHSPILRCLERRGTQEDKAITKNGEDTRISECRRDAALRVFRRMSAFSSGPAPTGQQSLLLLLLRLSCGRTTPGYDASTLHGLHLPLTSNASKVRYHFMQNHMFLYSSSQCLCAKREIL